MVPDLLFSGEPLGSMWCFPIPQISGEVLLARGVCFHQQVSPKHWTLSVPWGNASNSRNGQQCQKSFTWQVTTSPVMCSFPPATSHTSTFPAVVYGTAAPSPAQSRHHAVRSFLGAGEEFRAQQLQAQISLLQLLQQLPQKSRIRKEFPIIFIALDAVQRPQIKSLPSTQSAAAAGANIEVC